MASFNKFQPFIDNLFEKVFKFSTDTFKIALTAAANAPVNTNGVLADLTEISYTFASSRTVSVTSSTQTAGTYSFIVADLVLTASGGVIGPYRYIVLYSDTAANDELVGWWDRGSDYTIADGDSLTLDFPVGAIISAT